MKTKIYFIGIIVSMILLTNFKGNSQNWAPIGATWYFSIDETTPKVPVLHFIPIISYFKLESEKDSIVNGWKCRKIIKSYPASEYKMNFCMYSDSNKVYEVENNQKYLLYDFNKKAGEYWILPKYDNDSVFVDSTSLMTLLNGQIRKIQYIHMNAYHWFWTGRIIENIGNEYSLFPNEKLITETTNGKGGSGIDIGNIRCYFESSIALIKSDTPCDYQNIDEYPLEDKVFVASPVSNEIGITILDYRIMPITNITIYNSNGIIVYQKKCNLYWGDGIAFSDKTPGIYFLKLTFKNNQVLFKKVLKY